MGGGVGGVPCTLRVPAASTSSFGHKTKETAVFLVPGKHKQTYLSVAEELLFHVSGGDDSVEVSVARPYRGDVVPCLERINRIPHVRDVGVPRGCCAAQILLLGREFGCIR